MTSLFFRVENELKNGPYFSPSQDISIIDYEKNKKISFRNHHIDNNHPSPYLDKLLQDVWNNNLDQDRYIFGFEDLTSLFNWFCEDLDFEYLKDYGYSVVCYEVNNLVKGEFQAIVKREDIIKLVDSMPF